MGSVTISLPCCSFSVPPRRLTSRIATRSPSKETSIFSSVAFPPTPWNCIQNTYSPSAGKVWVTEMPPRDP